MREAMAGGSVAQVGAVVDYVRRRWRLARVLRGLAIAVAAVLVLLVIAAFALEATKYSPSIVIASRTIVGLAAVAIVVWLVLRPMLPRPRDEQVALYVEEHEPSLEGALVSAVEMSKGEIRSPIIAERVRAMAVERTTAVGGGRRVDERGMRLAFASLGGAAAMLLLVLTLGPDSMRYGMSALLTPWRDAEEVNPFRLDVEPGDATVARGASVVISAEAVGFQPGSAEVWARTSDTAQWSRVPMTADSNARFTARLLDVAAPTEYLIETNGLRSRSYRLKVADLPYAKRIDLEYRYPAYTGLATQRVDSAGDIAAVTGTMVRVRVTPTVATPGGRLIVDGGDTLALTAASDGALVGMLKVKKSGFYRVELAGARGDLLTASLTYSIDALPDRPPSVRFNKPGRDSRVLAVDEVYTEARAEDDYGVSKLELVYSVNGAPEKTAPLHQTTRVIKDIAAGHTFMLEDYALQPGDVVSYYARATDNDAISGPKSVTSDIYFLNVRPYAQEYRQEQGGGGGGGGGGQQNEAGELSKRQRDIVAGTFNINRDSAGSSKKTIEEDMATLRLAQQRLREDVQTLAERLVSRGVTEGDSSLAKIAQILPLAAAQMDTAESRLADGRLKDAIAPEQRALQQLQRAEAEYRNRRISMGQQQGGGGGGGEQQQAEDLADLFELQRDRMRNQYEEVQRGEQNQEQNTNQQVDATAERLKQLAARQQQENERARRKADSLSMGASGSSGGEGQRQLAQQLEEEARRLERLAREQQNQTLEDAARRMNQAADAMRRAAAQGGQRGAQESQAAADQLKEARRLLDNERNNRVQRAVDEAAETGRRLAEEQRQVQADVDRQSSAQGQERQELQRSIEQRKGAMADSVKSLATRLDRIALDGRREQPQVADQVQEAADTLRRRRIEDKIRITQNSLNETPQEYQNLNERLIGSDIAQLNKELEQAQQAARSGRASNSQQREGEQMDRARELVRGMESLDERRQQGQQNQQGQQGQQGQSQEGQRSQGQGGGAPGMQGQERGGAGGIANGQAAREMRERLNDARGLRRELQQRGGVDLTELDRAIGQMEGLTRAMGSGTDARAEAALRQQVIEGLRSFEFSLGRAFGVQGTERVLVDRAGEVPPQYRKYVEEYYRSLGRAKPK